MLDRVKNIQDKQLEFNNALRGYYIAPQSLCIELFTACEYFSEEKYAYFDSKKLGIRDSTPRIRKL